MRRIAFLLGIFLTAIGLLAQQTVTVQAQSYQVSDNLDLEAVAITFGESKNVEDFERNISDFGYYIYSRPVREQSQTTRASRAAPVVQIAGKEAGAFHSGSIIVQFEA